MNEYAVDTMALILRLEKRKLPHKVKTIFEEAENRRAIIHVPSMVFAEIGYLSAKNKIDVSLVEVQRYIDKYPSINEMPLNLRIIRTAMKATNIPELHDQLISATAKELNCPLITNDPEIISSKFVRTIWEK